jgi:hypothetical protein
VSYLFISFSGFGIGDNQMGRASDLSFVDHATAMALDVPPPGYVCVKSLYSGTYKIGLFQNRHSKRVITKILIPKELQKKLRFLAEAF